MDTLENIRTSCFCRDSNRRPYMPQPSCYAAYGAPSPAVDLNLKHFPKRKYVCMCIYIYIYTHTHNFISSMSQGQVYPSVERSAVQSVLKFVPGDISSLQDNKYNCLNLKYRLHQNNFLSCTVHLDTFKVFYLPTAAQ
jgi:hypothetical protein